MSKLPVFMILGSEGLLGRAFSGKLVDLADDYRVFQFDHKKADVTSPEAVLPLAEYVKPTVIFNCAGINDEDLCEEAKSGAFMVNSRGAETLARIAKKLSAKLVTFSPAAVFNGNGDTPYHEKNKVDPLNVLGRSKVSGEVAVRDACPDHLIIRSGWPFHYNGDNVLTRQVAQLERAQEIPVLIDIVGSPTFVPDLVDATLDLVARNATGTFHIANSGHASQSMFAEAMIELTKAKAKVVPFDYKSQNWWKAPLPKYSVLSTKKYSTATGKEMRNWLDALKQCLFTMNRFRP